MYKIYNLLYPAYDAESLNYLKFLKYPD